MLFAAVEYLQGLARASEQAGEGLKMVDRTAKALDEWWTQPAVVAVPWKKCKLFLLGE